MKKQDIAYGRIYARSSVIFIILMSLIYLAGGEAFHQRVSRNTIEEFQADNIVGDITAGREIAQYWTNEIETIQQIGLLLSNYNKGITGDVRISLWKEDTGELLLECRIEPEEIGLNQYYYIDISDAQGIRYQDRLKLLLSSEHGEEGLAATALYSSSKELMDGELYLDGVKTAGSLCITVQGTDEVWTGNHYREVVLILWAVWSAVYFLSVFLRKRGKREFLFSTGAALQKYGFLIEQLVKRDFKIRYKRSVLGVFWSFLNPLLTMMVQYVVFSQLFKADIENFPLYLLSGLIVFNFFTEAVGVALGSIVYNAHLITKVYMPKYIYPLTRVLSSSVNFLISMLPLFIMVLITGEKITKAYIVIPYLMVCVILFSIGVGMLLASLMVFFRDIQFLWGIVSLLWMYLTALFYPASIIPQEFQWVLTYNPMYYYVTFLRTIVLEGTSPEPIVYLQCLLFAAGACLIGGLVFKKTQNKFILYI